MDVVRAEHRQLRGRPLGAVATTAGGMPLPAVVPSKCHPNAAHDVGAGGSALTPVIIGDFRLQIDYTKKLKYSINKDLSTEKGLLTLVYPSCGHVAT